MPFKQLHIVLMKYIRNVYCPSRKSICITDDLCSQRELAG